ncbi:hypothetical protein IU459_36685 [Nocardia amamiensis]|uniref:Cutinase family protein n=1 Tax=Nocardia amamiensis TaxID=404578 RepID=A0ABS0D2I3_9NOCA|nr:hypothetical protein [Nocardia amamiensis]MBF6303004.1 hypothetical protein [Nocardia amamiensis]
MEVESTPNPVVIAGYAQGAAVAGNFAADVGQSWDLHSKVIACALIADPLRPSGQMIGSDPGGYGILGERNIEKIPAYWAAAPGDLTTALSADSSLRMVPEIFNYLELASEEDMLHWGRNLIDALMREQLRPYPFAQRQWRGRGPELTRVSGYLFTRPYIDNYVQHGHAARLAQIINTEVSVRD